MCDMDVLATQRASIDGTTRRRRKKEILPVLLVLLLVNLFKWKIANKRPLNVVLKRCEVESNRHRALEKPLSNSWYWTYWVGVGDHLFTTAASAGAMCKWVPDANVR